MNSKPRDHRLILRSPELVRAALEGRKTQDRVLVKPQPGKWFHAATWDDSHMSVHCPFRVGDRVWCAETWQSASAMNIVHPADDYTVYRATDPDWDTYDYWCWRPPQNMPKVRSRIWYTITGRRVERLQEISEEDALAEGVCATCTNRQWLGNQEHPRTFRCGFTLLWNSLHPNPEDQFEANPYVWMLEMERIER